MQLASFIPSPSNTAGTALGALAGAVVVASAPSWPFIITVAASIGMTPIGLAGVLGIGAASLANYLVTHISEVKNLNDMVSTWWPQIQRTYPQDPLSPLSKSNINEPAR